MREIKELVEFSVAEKKLLQRLDTPVKIQDFLNSFRYKNRKGDPILRSVRTVVNKQEANCIEGALLAATALWYHGAKPLLMDLVSDKSDLDHVVALFKVGGYWGALSKTNHVVLRYREPVYKSVRELAMSYFHEYFLDNGKKTFRSYSKPFDLSRLPDTSWITSGDDVWELANILDQSPHNSAIPRAMIRRLRLADKIERKAGKLTEW